MSVEPLAWQTERPPVIPWASAEPPSLPVVPPRSVADGAMRIEIPAGLDASAGRERMRDFQLVDVRLKDGRLFSKLAVRGGRYITGRESDPNFEGALPFAADDIAQLRPARLLGRLWPFWPTAR